MTSKFLVSLLAAIPACVCQSQAPFACNLKAFTPQERARHHGLSDRLMPAVQSARERSDGYALQVDARKIGFVDVAEWVDLERKCCPFFDFSLDLHGEDGALWLSLTGREGVKQFIEMDFVRLRDKLGHH